jgi:SAM-dependent methyltransferase
MFHDWSHAAEVRRIQIESGRDTTFSHVFLPYYQNLLAKIGVKRVLEVGCGTGHLSKSLAPKSSDFVAIDPSVGMYQVARQTLSGMSVELLNVTLEDYTVKRPFELVLAHLCVQFFSDVDDFCSLCARALLPNGMLVFSLPHPCFWNDYKAYFPRDDFKYTEERFTTATLEISNDPTIQIGGVPYHHRPIGRYVSAITGVGLRIERLDEIFPDEDTHRLYPTPWLKPRYCVFHARKI